MAISGRKQQQLEARARVLKSLSHPTRLFIVDQLSSGERCVCELQQEIGADMSTVSKHLALLREAGVVRSEKRGTQVFYSLAGSCVPGFLDCIGRLARDHARRSTAWVR